jgi:hypothetical protein
MKMMSTAQNVGGGGFFLAFLQSFFERHFNPGALSLNQCPFFSLANCTQGLFEAQQLGME